MSGITMHDHEKKPNGGVFCPLMKERCYDGWTPSMGIEKTGENITKPTCVRWVGVYVNDPKVGKAVEVFDCKDRWDTDMLQQVAQEVYQGAAATEQVRNHVAEANGVSRIALAFFSGIAKRMKAPVRLPEPPRPKELTNGQGGEHERHGADGQAPLV